MSEEKKASINTEPSADRPSSSQGSPRPEANFSTFIFSLNSSALYHLGILPDPKTGAKDKNLVLAKQTIDILSMLQEKTKGNLGEDESRMLKNILYDLRILYVKESK